MFRTFTALFVLLFTLSIYAGEMTEADNELLFAVQAMNIAKARAAIRKGGNVNGVDDDGWPLFISAVNSNSAAMVNLFMRSGVKVDITGPDGKTPLMHALSGQSFKIAYKLIGAGASLKKKDATGKTVMMYAAEAGKSDIVRKAIKKGADVYAKDNSGRSALNFAMGQRDKRLIKFLGQYEVLPTDFLFAVEAGNTVKARTLLRKGVSPNLKNESGEPPLFVAIRNKDRMMLKLLLEFDADVNFKNSQGYTILMYCIAKKQVDLAKELLKYGGLADFNFKYAEGKTALMISILTKDRRFIKSILKFRQNVNARDNYGNTALIYAAGVGMGDIVKELLKKGAKKDIKRKDGRTALDIAKAKNYIYIQKLLK